MSLRADRMSPAQRTLLRCVLACAVWWLLTRPVLAEGELERAPSRVSATSLPLPPRANGHEAASSPRSKTTANNGGLWTTVLALGAIVGSLALAGRWLKPYLGAPRGLPIEALELLGRRQIEPKVAVHLVRCGGKVLLLGVSPDGVRTLSEITDPQEVARLTEACQNVGDPRSSAISRQTTAVRDPRAAALASKTEAVHA